MRLCFVLGGTEEYGNGGVTASLASAWATAGHEVSCVVATDGPLLPLLSSTPAEVTRLRLPAPPPFRRDGSRLERQRFRLRLRAHRRVIGPAVAAAVRRIAPHAVVLQHENHVPWLRGLPPGVAPRRLWLMATGVRPTKASLLRRQLRRAGVVPLANSHHTAATLATKAFPVEVQHLGVDTRRFRPGRDDVATPAELGLPPGGPVLGVFARLVPEKGHDLVLDAVARLGDPQLRVLFVGGPLDGPHSARLHRRVAELGLGERVALVGYRDDPERLYGACDLTVLPTTIPEGFGLTVVESMACGVPSIAPAQGGPMDVVHPGTTGWLFSPGSVDDLHAALRQALAQRADWPTIGRAAAADAAHRFSLAGFSAAVLERLGAPA